MLLRILLLFIIGVESKFHHLSLLSDSRRNVIISYFGYGSNGTLDIGISNFTVPDKIKDSVDSTENADKLQTDQGFDAIFFFADLPNKRLRIYRSGIGKYIKICATNAECQESDAIRIPKPEELIEEKKKKPVESQGWFKNIFGRFLSPGAEEIAYENYVPLRLEHENQYSTNISFRFDGKITGDYFFMFHNCYNYRAHGYSDRVAVDLTVDLVERNVHSYLSDGDIAKPYVLLYISIMFFSLGIYWCHILCRSEPNNIYRMHKFMAVLVFLKALSLFFHGFNYYFLSKYGMQKQFWAVLFYITHLIKGSLLFGTIILIGTGYTFIKQFLTNRDRRIFMTVLPIQVLDNIFLIILSESEVGAESHDFWLKLFIFMDFICCILVASPIVSSIQHLKEGAATDGKAAENLNRLRLYKEFYLIVVMYIYITRLIGIMVKYFMPISYDWIVLSALESINMFFFVIVGYKFRPSNTHNYLLLVDEDDLELKRKKEEENVKHAEDVEQFLAKAYSDHTVSRRLVSDESAEGGQQKLSKKNSQTLLDD
ncbi:unnamed protein product [Caenorhabditis bovis]|uniref:GOST seven transmembrane domain-containing protein n=1 Tax=Caenorhabditis bovis TaxID=2654633 RepID=A0A8S1EGP7_9PELO|nr:unnamed protein product [Caenorhabditis bovis]